MGAGVNGEGQATTCLPSSPSPKALKQGVPSPTTPPWPPPRAGKPPSGQLRERKPRLQLFSMGPRTQTPASGSGHVVLGTFLQGPSPTCATLTQQATSSKQHRVLITS